MAARKKKGPRKKAAVRAPRKAPEAAVPLAPAVLSSAELVAIWRRTTTTGEMPAVSVPGGPSAHPGRAGVPAQPTRLELAGSAFVGRPVAGLSMYRAPPVEQGGKEADMCAGCDVDCCTGHVIPLNALDAWRIRSGMDIPFADFVGLVPWSKGAPCHYVRLGDARYTMVLRRRGDGSCSFLVRVGQERRCGIHALRPDACRIFPYLPDVETQVAQPGHNLVQLHPSFCPWRWPSTPEHKARVLKDIADNTDHRKLDRDVLSTWYWALGVEKTVENFYAFLEEELARRMTRPHEKSRFLTTLW
jgi:Fe-S-cluster containining protein